MVQTAALRADAPPPAIADAAILAATARVADGPLAAAAARIDHGEYPLPLMAELGAAGALGAHLDRNGGRFGLAISTMERASRACGATGFLMWAHDVCGLYMEQSGNPALMGAMLEDHAAGRTFGGTALSNPMKAFSGIEPLLFRARKVAGGYVVRGNLPWVSHIGRGQYCGAIAGVEGADGAVSHEIMFLLRCDDRADLRTCPTFSGMEGTSTFGIRLDDYFVPEADLIADPARPFIGRIKAAFILLQTGMALGVSAGAIASMREVEGPLGHVNQFLDDQPDALEEELDEMRTAILALAQTPYETAKDYLLNVLDARAQGAEFALRTTQAALLHQGARGYLASAGPQRRIREAHFVAIVTPAIKHLRWEMARLSREVQPAAGGAA
ncbi:acyl-CoA dehydrogenase family protein [Aquabacter cavernae]|uniref:acyl-CoA dehydrogenase family protein n=1 Tax=Aquabacter cavernae TaxID=2496029 RepID=UPI000F8D8225|nr:acyl-CoA dehydrogenase family protein [Aquabacter cavernae]